MDAQGAAVAERFTQSAGATFTTAVDRAQGLWELYGFNVIPNGFFVDERGILRYLKVGGFDVRNPQDRQAIESLLAAPAGNGASESVAPKFRSVEDAVREAQDSSDRDPQNLDKLLTLGERRLEAKDYARARGVFESALKQDTTSVRALVGLATIHLDLGDREKALVALRKAWAIEPQNWIIRKQIWAIEHPDQFYPAINTGWQKEQIRKEDAARK